MTEMTAHAGNRSSLPPCAPSPCAAPTRTRILMAIRNCQRRFITKFCKHSNKKRDANTTRFKTARPVQDAPATSKVLKRVSYINVTPAVVSTTTRVYGTKATIMSWCESVSMDGGSVDDEDSSYHCNYPEFTYGYAPYYTEQSCPSYDDNYEYNDYDYGYYNHHGDYFHEENFENYEVTPGYAPYYTEKSCPSYDSAFYSSPFDIAGVPMVQRQYKENDICYRCLNSRADRFGANYGDGYDADDEYFCGNDDDTNYDDETVDYSDWSYCHSDCSWCYPQEW